MKKYFILCLLFLPIVMACQQTKIELHGFDGFWVEGKIWKSGERVKPGKDSYILKKMNNITYKVIYGDPLEIGPAEDIQPRFKGIVITQEGFLLNVDGISKKSDNLYVMSLRSPWKSDNGATGMLFIHVINENMIYFEVDEVTSQKNLGLPMTGKEYVYIKCDRADPHEESKEKQEAFFFVKNGNTQGLKEKFDKGFSPNTRDANGNTLLFHALKKNDITMVKFLLGNKADPNLKTKGGNTNLLIASAMEVDNPANPMMNLLLQYGADKDDIKNNPSFLTVAARACSLPMTKYLLEQGANPNLVDTYRQVPILSIGPVIDYEEVDRLGIEPEKCKQADAVEQLLLQYGSKTREEFKKELGL